LSEIREQFAARINPVSINIETLEFLGELVRQQTIERVLEFGSGVSTEFWSEHTPNAHVISFENSRRYAKITRSRIRKSANNTVVKFAPLRRMKLFGLHYISYKIGSFLEKNAPKKPFDLVLIDGPPGYLYAREATLFQALPYIDEHTTIVLDDAERPIEKQTVERWGELFEMKELTYHSMGKKKIAVFSIDPVPRAAQLPEMNVHTRSNMRKLFFTFHKRNIMHNLWLLKMRVLNKEPFPDQKMNQSDE
jgi:predicted O-methyltransferase YrrM